MAKLEVPINLMQVAADPVEDFARADRGQVVVAQAVVPVDQILNAVGLGEKFSAIEGVYIDLCRGGLVAANEMSRQADSGEL